MNASGLPNFSNAIAINNSLAASIASDDLNADGTEDTSYVDFVRLVAGTPPSAQVIQTHSLGVGTTNLQTIAGLASDVAITPDGARAVVASRNWIHVFDGSGILLAAFNVGSNPAGACQPDEIRHGLAITNERAVILMRRRTHLAPIVYQTWVYILDLASASPSIMLEHHLADPTAHDDLDDLRPHDVEITPDGSIAVVTASQIVGVYQLDVVLQTGQSSAALVGTLLESGRYRSFDRIYDSLEVSNDRAVVCSYDLNAVPAPWFFDIKVLRIANAFGPVAPVALLTTTGFTTVVSADVAWDVDLSSDGAVAGVKCSASDVITTDVDQNSQTVVRIGHPGANPLASGSTAFEMNAAVRVPPAYVDPATNGNNGNNVHRWVAFMGRAGSTSSQTTRVHFYDIAQPPNMGVYPEKKYTLLDNTFSVEGIDLDFTDGQRYVVLRTTAPPDEINPATTVGRDWWRFDLRPAGGGLPSIVPVDPLQTGADSIGGKGACIGVDSHVQHRQVSVSISNDPTKPPFSPAGWVHFVRTNN